MVALKRFSDSKLELNRDILVELKDVSTIKVGLSY